MNLELYGILNMVSTVQKDFQGDMRLLFGLQNQMIMYLI